MHASSRNKMRKLIRNNSTQLVELDSLLVFIRRYNLAVFARLANTLLPECGEPDTALLQATLG